VAPEPPAPTPEPEAEPAPPQRDEPAPQEAAPQEPAPQEPPPPEPEPERAEPGYDLGCPLDAPGCTLAEDALNTFGRPRVPPPAVTLNKPNGVYRDGDYLVIRAKAPTTLGGYLFIDVLTDAGDVYHLLPEPLTRDNAIERGEQIQIGVESEQRAAGVREWQVSAPFGPGYVFTTISQQPIYEGLRPIAEPLEDYRPVLLDALANQETNTMAVQLERVEFRPRE
jgi:hypothetical protein